jgi:hypothetical protein
MIEKFGVFTPRPTNKTELMTVLEAIWQDLPQDAIDLAVLSSQKKATGMH